MLPNSNGVQPTYFNPDSRQNVSVHVTALHFSIVTTA